MIVKDILNQSSPVISFEFFPPKTENAVNTLFQTLQDLVPLQPAYVSVTFGAGGSTRELTHDLVVKIQNETKLTVVAHLTCIGSSKDEINQILQNYRKNNVKNILALRGDPPKGTDSFKPHPDGFFFAKDLVAFIKKGYPDMGIGVAGFPEGHPEAPNRLMEIDLLKEKIDAGADYICSQLFFDNNDFYDFQERCKIAGINVPIIAGIMPITTQKGMLRMAELAARSRFPAKLQNMVLKCKNDQEVEKVGIAWTCEQVQDLINNNVRGIHFYTLNRSTATREIYNQLNLFQYC